MLQKQHALQIREQTNNKKILEKLKHAHTQVATSLTNNTYN